MLHKNHVFFHVPTCHSDCFKWGDNDNAVPLFYLNLTSSSNKLPNRFNNLIFLNMHGHRSHSKFKADVVHDGFKESKFYEMKC